MRFLRLFCVVSAVFFLSGLSMGVYNARAAASDEIAKCEKELAAVRKDLELQRKKVSESPELANIKKEIADLGPAINNKDKELAATLDARINKNQEYLELAARSRELNGINVELRKARAAADSDPEVKKVQKEAQELRARAQALDMESRKAADAKFNSDPKVKEFLARQSGLKNASREESDFRRKAMNEPQIKALQSESTELRKKLIAKNNELRTKADSVLKTDQKLKSLDLKVKELNQKLAQMKKSQAPARPAPAAAAKAPAKETAKKWGGLLGILKKK